MSRLWGGRDILHIAEDTLMTFFWCEFSLMKVRACSFISREKLQKIPDYPWESACVFDRSLRVGPQKILKTPLLITKDFTVDPQLTSSGPPFAHDWHRWFPAKVRGGGAHRIKDMAFFITTVSLVKPRCYKSSYLIIKFAFDYLQLLV